jgi:hypothetical protein
MAASPSSKKSLSGRVKVATKVAPAFYLDISTHIVRWPIAGCRKRPRSYAAEGDELGLTAENAAVHTPAQIP